MQKFKRILFLTNWEKRGAFHDRVHQGHIGNKAHTILAKIAKLLSLGLRPIFGGEVRNNCHVVCISDMMQMMNDDVYRTRTCVRST